MLIITVTGKPKHWVAVPRREGSKVEAKFVLVEKRWYGGELHDVYWTVAVPAHKVLWAKMQFDKGYTIAVTARDIAFVPQGSGDSLTIESVLMLDEISPV